MSTIERITFHDDELLVVTDERTGKEFVIPKQMVDMFELDWSSQRRKLMHSQLFKKGVVISTLPSAGGNQDTVLLERRLVHAWLLSLNAGKVAPHLQEKLERYQDECADVLDRYFSKQSQIPQVKDPALQALITMSEQVKTLVVELDATRQIAHAAEEKAVRAETKADLALEHTHHMTVKEFIGKNGLLRQFPLAQHKRISAWLKRYSLQYGLQIRKSPVHGESWDDENSYKIDAFFVWLKWEQTKPQQGTLVPFDQRSHTP